MIREGDIGEKLFPDFPDMKVDFSEIGIGKIGKIGLAPPPKIYNIGEFQVLKLTQSFAFWFTDLVKFSDFPLKNALTKVRFSR